MLKTGDFSKLSRVGSRMLSHSKSVIRMDTPPQPRRVLSHLARKVEKNFFCCCIMKEKRGEYHAFRR